MIASYSSTDSWPDRDPNDTSSSSVVYNSSYGCGYRYYFISNSCDCTTRRHEEDDEEAKKQAHAAAMRKRDLSYLWREALGLRRLRFKVQAPTVRFIPCWSPRRWRSLT